MTIRLKAGIALVLVVATVVLLWFSYPEHWLKHVNKFATVTVDDRQVPAEAYLGHPTENEAEAFLLVNISGVGDYMFNFEEESYRQVSRREFVRLRGGVVTFKPMSIARLTLARKMAAISLTIWKIRSEVRRPTMQRQAA